MTRRRGPSFGHLSERAAADDHVTSRPAWPRATPRDFLPARRTLTVSNAARLPTLRAAARALHLAGPSRSPESPTVRPWRGTALAAVFWTVDLCGHRRIRATLRTRSKPPSPDYRLTTMESPGHRAAPGTVDRLASSEGFGLDPRNADWMIWLVCHVRIRKCKYLPRTSPRLGGVNPTGAISEACSLINLFLFGSRPSSVMSPT